MRVIPLLMLHQQQLYKSIAFGKRTYIGDPLVAVKIFNEKEAQEICLVDIDPCRDGKSPNFGLLKDIAGECFMPLSYGGGITSVETAKKILYSGFEKIVVNSELHRNFNILSELTTDFGSSSVVVSVDYKNVNGIPTVFSNGGKKNTEKNVFDFLKQIEDAGAGEILLTSIDRDGSRSGVDIELLKRLKDKHGIPLIISGGIGKMAHIEDALAHGADAVAAGSLFVYKGSLNAVLINYPEKAELKKLVHFIPQNHEVL